VVTVKNAYPLPLIQNILNKVSEPRLNFTNWTFAGGTTTFGSKKETSGRPLFRRTEAFQTSGHVLRPHKQSCTFQTMMNDIFKELITRE